MRRRRVTKREACVKALLACVIAVERYYQRPDVTSDDRDHLLAAVVAMTTPKVKLRVSVDQP